VAVADGQDLTETRSYLQGVNPAGGAIPIITTTNPLPVGTTGTPYNLALQATGGSTPYSWLIVTGALPIGLNLNTTNGNISGTPTTAGTSSFRVKVTGSNSSFSEKDFSLTINSQQTGSIQVSIVPQAAADGGAQWRLTTDGLWRNSGSIAGGLAFGTYTIQFKDIPGWITPANKQVQITLAVPDVLINSDNYIQQPQPVPFYVQVTRPTSKETIGGSYHLSGVAQDGSGIIQKIEFYIDSDMTPACFNNNPNPSGIPFGCIWDSTRKPDGPHAVTVRAYNPSGFSTLSPPIAFNINNSQAPILISLDPNNVDSGGPGFTLTVNGSNFTSSSIITFDNAEDFGTTFVSANQLKTFIPPGTIKFARTHDIRVRAPNPIGVLSNVLTLIVNYTTPRVSIVAIDPIANETNGGSGSFSVQRVGGDLQVPLTVRYAVSGTATNGVDYTALGGSLTLLTGNDSAGIMVLPIPDLDVEGDETVTVTLSPDSGYIVDSPSSATVTIVDDDIPSIPKIGVMQSTIAPGGTLSVAWTGIDNPSATDSVGLYSGESNKLASIYVSCTNAPAMGKSTGVCPFVLPMSLVEGTYQVFLIAGNATLLAESNPFVVKNGPTITTSSSSATAGGTSVVSWSGIISPIALNSIGLFPFGGSNTDKLKSIYLSCSSLPGFAPVAGTCPFVIPQNVAVGQYELRLLADDGATVLARTDPFTVTLPLPGLFQGLGDLPGGSFDSQAFGISANGLTVVGQSNSANGFEAFRWSAQSGIVSLGTLRSIELSNSSTALAISADGSTIVGQNISGTSGTPFIWNSNVGMLRIPDVSPSLDCSKAKGVSADGLSVVGILRSDCGNNPGNDFEGFKWSATEGLLHLGDLPGGKFRSEANGISANGSTIAGWSESGIGPNSQDAAFAWTQSNGMVGLGGNDSRANAVSVDGSIIVGQFSGANRTEAFRWTQSSGIVGLGQLQGITNQTQAYGVSADGAVVVGVSESSSGDLTAFIWDAANGIRKLQDVLTSYGLNLTGWTLQSAPAISADGRTIVGYGINPSGNREAWIARLGTPDTTPPDTLIASSPPTVTNLTTATFSFTSTEENSTFACKLDAGSFAACGSPQIYGNLPAGSHTFQVRATDGAGNTDPTPASFTWTIDTTPPSTNITGGPTGTINVGNADFSWSGTDDITASANLLYAYRLDPIEQNFSAFGPATAKPYTDLANGPYIFLVKAKDQAGNEGVSASRSFTVAVNNPPNIPTGLGQFKSNGTTPIAVGDTIDETTVVFKATVSDPDGNNVKLQVEVKPIGTAFSNVATTESSLVSNGLVAQLTVTGLPQGSYHWQARAVDGLDSPSLWVSFGSNAETANDFVVTVTRTLTVASTPSSGASITVSPNDNSNQGNGSTPFTRIYNNNTLVTLTAALVAAGNNFSSWTGCDSSSGTTCNVTMSADKTVTATYVPLAVTLAYNQPQPLQDRVGQGNHSQGTDGHFDPTFTVSFPSTGGTRTVTSLRLDGTSNGGTWDTNSATVFWTLGAAANVGAPLYNQPDDSVGFPVVPGGTFVIFASDWFFGPPFPNGLFQPGNRFDLTISFSDGTTATAFTILTGPTAPSITNLAPTSGPVGTSVTISGSNFGASQGSSMVTFNGVTATSISSWNSTTIIASVPPGATTGPVVVTTGSGQSNNNFTFTVTPSGSVTLAYNDRVQDRVGQGNQSQGIDGHSDPTFTVTFPTGGVMRTVTSLRLDGTSNGGTWDTNSATVSWTLGAARDLVSALLNLPDDSVNFLVSPGVSFVIFASDWFFGPPFPNGLFQPGNRFDLTIGFSDGSTATANATIPVSNDGLITLTYNDRLRDRVGQNNQSQGMDGHFDPTFTVTFPTGGSTRTVTSLRLDGTSSGGTWDTNSATVSWTLGAAPTLDAPSYNGANDAVNFPVPPGGTFNIFASDWFFGPPFPNGLFQSGNRFDLTIGFSDGSTAITNASVP
jgi:probable HAF family extracellular repeat protein